MNNPDIIAYLIELLDEKKWSSNILEIEADEKVKSNNFKFMENPFKIKITKDFIESQIVDRQISVVKSLGNIGYKNKNAIDALTQIIHSKRHIKIKYQAAISLGKINPENQEIIPLLIHLLVNQGREKTNFEDRIADMIEAAQDILIQQLDSHSFQEVVTGLKGFLIDFYPQPNSDFFGNYRAANNIALHPKHDLPKLLPRVALQ